MPLVNSFGLYEPNVGHPGPVPTVSSSGGTGAQLEGDGPPVDVPDLDTDETIFYWDRTNQDLYVYDSVLGWHAIIE